MGVGTWRPGSGSGAENGPGAEVPGTVDTQLPVEGRVAVQLEVVEDSGTGRGEAGLEAS